MKKLGTFHLGPLSIPVYEKDLDGVWGECSTSKQEIYISEDTRGRMRHVTLLHELTHLALDVLAHPKNVDGTELWLEEDICDAVGLAVAQNWREIERICKKKCY